MMNRLGARSRFTSTANPRHGDVDDRAEEEESSELGLPALHGNILRHILPSPAAFGQPEEKSPTTPCIIAPAN